MKDNNNHITYSAADIEKYWKGELSAQDQHAMEKAALEDPFLADAMEGYEASWPLLDANNSDLKQRLSERVHPPQKNKVIALGWWKIAAAVIILAGAGWWYSSTSNTTVAENGIVKNEQLAPKEKNKAVTEDSIAPINGLLNYDTTHDLAMNDRKPPAASKSIETVAAGPETQPAPGALSPAQVPVAVASESVPAAADKESTAASAEYKKRDEVAAAKEEPVANATARGKTISIGDNRNREQQALAGKTNNVRNGYGNNFMGTLTDQGNKPIANALIQIPNLKVATQTDRKGNFSFQAMDTIVNVSIAAEGFETQHIRLHDSATLNQIVLRPVPQNADDIVVQTDGAPKKSRPADKSASIKILDAEPVIGWTAYNEYLDKNKKVSAAAEDIHGTVVVSFTVRNKSLGNFAIEQSLDDELDEEAIRLIKHGPAWKLLKGKKANATVIVKF